MHCLHFQSSQALKNSLSNVSNLQEPIGLKFFNFNYISITLLIVYPSSNYIFKNIQIFFIFLFCLIEKCQINHIKKRKCQKKYLTYGSNFYCAQIGLSMKQDNSIICHDKHAFYPTNALETHLFNINTLFISLIRGHNVCLFDFLMFAYLLVISMVCGFIKMSPTMVGGKLGN